MVAGVQVCGAFVTKKVLIITAVLLVLSVIVASVLLGVGGTMSCYGYGSYSCSSTQVSLMVNGGVLLALSVIGLIITGILATQLKQPRTLPQMNVPQYTYATPGTAAPFPPHTHPSYPGPHTQPNYPQQYPPAAATTYGPGNSNHQY